MYDVIIIGMGISGITAAIYAHRKNLKVLILDKSMPGGMLNNLNTIANYPGLPNIKGVDFALKLFNQIEVLKIPYALEEVLKIEVNSNEKKVITKTKEYTTHNIILATGKKPRFLGIENEQEFLGRGISTCATCDGKFFENEVIAVVGSNKQALEETLYLAPIVKQIYFLNEQSKINGSEELLKKVKEMPNVIIKNEVKVSKINITDAKISSITLDNGETLVVKGLFLYRGYLPNTDLVKDLDITNQAGFVLVNENLETKIKGLYAIGDVIKKDIYQLVTAAYDGLKVINNINKN